MALRYSDYDRRRYPTVDVREGYARWAAMYEETMTGDIDVRLLEALEHVDWRAAQVADLACGTGRIGRWVAERGAGAERRTGVDLCPEMLARARELGGYTELIQADVRQTPLVARSYELVSSVLAVEHLPELTPFYSECARLLVDGGQLVLIGYHPHFLLNGIPTHFRDSSGEQVAIENTIHLFSDHVRAARGLGFELEESLEPVIDDSLIERLPTWEKYRGLPASFALVWRLTSRV